MGAWGAGRQKLSEVSSGKSTPVAQFRRSKDPTRFWTIYRDAEGQLWCNCPSWLTRHHTHGDCKHLKKLKTEGLEAVQAMEDTAQLTRFKRALAASVKEVSVLSTDETIAQFVGALVKEGFMTATKSERPTKTGVSRLITFDEDD